MKSFDLSLIRLLPEGAVLILETGTLVVADLHLGKAAAFRAHGLPVPDGDTARDLGRLEALARGNQAREIVVAGDLFHAPSGVTAEVADTLGAFIAQLARPFLLVGGNHDAKLKRLPAGLEAASHLDRGPLRIIHDPAEALGTPQLCLAGHWHPVARIRDGARTSLRLPCFLLRGNTVILPAFGSFTGGAVVDSQPGDRMFVALRDQVVEVPDRLRGD